MFCLTKMRLPTTEIKTYKNANNNARKVVLRLRFLVVKIIKNGAARMTKNAISCSTEMLSPRKMKPSTKYNTGASWTKIPRLVESSISRVL